MSSVASLPSRNVHACSEHSMRHRGRVWLLSAQMCKLRLDRLRQRRGRVARMGRACRFDEHDPGLLRRVGEMLDAARYNVEVTGLQHCLAAVAVAEDEGAAMHQEEFVFIGMRVPDELALHLGELYILAGGDGD